MLVNVYLFAIAFFSDVECHFCFSWTRWNQEPFEDELIIKLKSERANTDYNKSLISLP